MGGGCSPAGVVGAGSLGAGAEKVRKPRERRRDPLWALIPGTFSFYLSTVLGAHGAHQYLFHCRGFLGSDKLARASLQKGSPLFMLDAITLSKTEVPPPSWSLPCRLLPPPAHAQSVTESPVHLPFPPLVL